MIYHFKRLSKDSAIYGLSGAISTLIGVFLAPILTRVFHPSDYGVIELLSTVTLVLAILLRFGLDSAIGVHYYGYSKEEDRKIAVSSSFWFVMGSTALFVGILQPFLAPLSKIIFGDSDKATYLRISLLALPFLLATNSSLYLLRLKFRAWNFTLINLLRVGLSLCLVIVFVVILNRGLTGYFTASFLVQVIAAGVGFFAIRRLLVPKISWVELKALMKIGLPLIPSGLSVWALNLLDRFFLVKMTSLHDVGLYSIGARVSTVVTLVVSAFQMAWGTYSLSIAKNPEAKATFQRTYHYYVILLCALTTALSVFAKEILVVLTTPAYASAQWVVAPLAFSVAAYGVYHIFQIGVTYTKKTKYATYSVFVAALVNVLFNFLLIPHFGIYGAAVATLLSYLVAVAMMYRYAQKLFPIPYHISKSVQVALVSVLFVGLGTFWSASFWITVLLKVCLLGMYAVIIWFVFISASERQFAYRTVKSLRLRSRNKQP